MKRLRDDVYVNPQSKRQFAPSSRGESYAPSNYNAVVGGGVSGGKEGGGGSVNVVNRGVTCIPAVGTQKLTTDDALTYLKDVKNLFQDQREKYDQFLDVMKGFKAQRIDTSGVIGRVKELFKGHPNLILGFNTFLPKGYEITLNDEDEAPPKRTVRFEEAISFVNKIKKRFQNDDHVYKSFLDILNMYRKEHKGITEVYQEVAALFDDQEDLLDEFTRFLPDTSASTLPPFGPHSVHRGAEKSSVVPPMRQCHVNKQQPRRDKVVTRDHSVEYPDVDDDKTALKLHKEHKKHTENRKNRDHDDIDHGNENNGDIRSFEKRKSARKVEDFGGTSNLASYDDKDAWKSMYRKEFIFCEKVKEKLCSAGDYQAFLNCLHIYSTEIITRKELQSLVSDLLGKFPDLMDGFNEFLERCEGIDGFLAGVMGKKSIRSEGNSSKALKKEEKEKDPKREVEIGKEKERYNSKYLNNSIQELDLSHCKSCSPSYRLLPEDYPISLASQRSELGAQVLNDYWVSVTSGSEDYSAKHMRRNMYEESLFRCEDDRFELDMLLGSASSTLERVNEILEGINNNTTDGSDGPINVDESLSALNLRCIERLYGDHGLEVIDILRKDASAALPVILSRLEQKHEEWTKCRLYFNKIWAEIYSKNHYKSLHHRMSYFKQRDSKNLSAKALVREIKEIKDKRQKEDEVLGSRHTFTPDLEFEYPNSEIHEDIYKIIKYSCEEICSSKEQLHKVMRLWTTFLEPMLGVNSRSRVSVTATEDNNDASKRQIIVKNTVTESEGSPNSKSNGNSDCSKSPQGLDSGKIVVKNVKQLAKEGLNVVSDVGVNHGYCTSSVRVNNGYEEINGVEPFTKDARSSVVPEASRLNQLPSVGFLEGSRPNIHKEAPLDLCNNEKEEGELSPNVDFEDNFSTTYQAGGSLEPLPEKNTGTDEMQRKTGGREENNCADPEAGEEVSGSESAADECPRDEDVEQDEADGKAESEGEAENNSESHCVGVDGVLVSSQSERFLASCKPLSTYVASSLVVGGEKKDGQVFYGNDAFYVLFRLHQALYERILTAKVNSVSGESEGRTTKNESSDPYARFMSALFNLLGGSSDHSKFEDDCRLLIGSQSYVLFTLDNLIYKLVKQLQTVSSDEMDCKLLQLYEYERSKKPENRVDSVYAKNIHLLLHDENIYRLECTSLSTRLTVQLMDDVNDKLESFAVSIDPNFASYLHNEYLSVDYRKKESTKIMLKRYLRKYANVDESIALYTATENALISNGLECKMSATTFKISYVLGTEDHFIRLGRRRENRPTGKLSRSDQRKVQKFHNFVEARLSLMPA